MRAYIGFDDTDILGAEVGTGKLVRRFEAMLPAPGWRIPIHRTDVGTLIVADLIGAKNCIFVKDEDGLYAEDPKKNPRAEFIPEITVKELLARNLDDLVIERPCLEIIQNSEVINRIQNINGLKRGTSRGLSTTNTSERSSGSPDRFLENERAEERRGG